MADTDYTIVANDDYVASTYEAPQVFSVVGRFVEKIIFGQDIETPNSILAFVSGDRNEQYEYIEGLIGIGIFLSSLVSIWFLALLLLKCQGRDRMGCSAGHAFHDSESDENNGTLSRGDDEDVSVGAAVDPDDSVAMDEPALRESRRASSSRHYKSYIYDSRNLDEIELHTELDNNSDDIRNLELHTELDNIVHSATRGSQTKSNETNRGKSGSLRSVPKTVKIGDESSNSDDESTNKNKRKASRKVWGQSFLCSPKPEHVERRKFQTRFVFAFFAILSLVCCVLLVTHMYAPLESAALTSGEVVQETSQIVDELNEVLEILDEAATATVVMVETTPLDYDVLCPNFSVENFFAEFGFNPQTMIKTVSTEYQNYLPTIVDALNTAKETGDAVTSMLRDVDEAVSTANQYLWIIPLVICITILIIFSQLALMLAVVYKEQKFKDIQTTVPNVENCYGWTILPLQTIVVLCSWLLVVAFCFGIIITTDSCMPSFSSAEMGVNSNRGTPDDVILAVVDQYMMITTDTDQIYEDLAKQRLATYITGCGGMESDPLAEVIILQGLLQNSVKEVDTQLAFASDVLGLQFIENQCGQGNQVRTFFENLTVLNGKFANVSKAIQQGYGALSCPRVNALYVEAVHGAFCTDFATANANGLTLLLMISFSGMILITLRASWRSAE